MIGLVLLLCTAALAKEFKVVGLDEEMNPHPPFKEPKDVWGVDASLPVEQQMIEITNESYDELITSRFGSSLVGDTEWVILFANKDHIDSKRAMVNYSAAAKLWGGKVRFGWVNRSQNELLAETFGVSQVPATYLIKDKVAYHYRDWTYVNTLEKYMVTEAYHNSTLSFR